MTWPSDDLIGDELDQSTDDPSLARTQLNSLLLKVQAMLAAINAGSTPWDSTSDGSGSGLDADLLDGSHLAAVLDRTNHTNQQAMSTISDAGLLAILDSINDLNWFGSDLSVDNGGSGRSLATAFGVLIGGTTSYGAHQSVAPGVFGQVLTSKGVSAPPVFENGVSGADFADTDMAIGLGASTASWDTGFGTNDFVWGVSGLSRDDSSTDVDANIRGRTGLLMQDFQVGTPVPADPGTPSAPSAGVINFTMTMGNSSRSYKLRLWARTLI